MCTNSDSKSHLCELISNSRVNREIFVLQFNWNGPAPKAGQFFMVKPERSSVFLPRPFSIFEYDSSTNNVKFLIVKNGRGTDELSAIHSGEKVRLTGPFGNSWSDFLPENGKAALVGGSAGVAPLAALVNERPDFNFHLYAGFKKGFNEKSEENAMLGCAARAKKLVIAAEDGRNAHSGLILNLLFDPGSYDVILGCGSMAMLNALKKKCESFNVPCYLSLENKFACGAGACLGCTIRTVKGNRRCCADGPIFPAGEIIFDE